MMGVFNNLVMFDQNVADSRPPCASTIERLIASPMPIPSGLVV
jgi:hypothetical protein